MSATLTGALSRRLALQAFAVLAGVGCVVYAATAFTLAQRQDSLLLEKQTLVRHLLAKVAPGEEVAHALQDVMLGHAELRVMLHGAKSNGETPVRDALKRLDFSVAQPGAEPLRVALLLDTAGDRALLNRLAAVLALAALAGASLMSAGSHLLVRRAMRPLQGLVQQLRGVSPGRLGAPLDGSQQPRELQPLIEQFNQLLGRLDHAYRQLEAFNANVAHELNTPLSLLVGSCQLGLQRARSEGEMREILAANLEDLDRLAGIVRDMLFLARADQGERALTSAPSSLAALAREVLEFHEAALQEAGLEAVVDGEAWLPVEPGLMRRALSNLIGNASRFATPGSRLRVCIAVSGVGSDGASDGGGQLELGVENQGKPLAPAVLERLFERFYRGEAAGQHGLGLAIVEAIARMHGGQGFACSGAQGTTIGLRLPWP